MTLKDLEKAVKRLNQKVAAQQALLDDAQGIFAEMISSRGGFGAPGTEKVSGWMKKKEILETLPAPKDEDD